MKTSLIALLALIVACMLLFVACGEKVATDTDGAEERTEAVQPEAELSSVIYEYSSQEGDDANAIQRYTFFYDESNIVKKVISEMTTDASKPGNIKEGLDYMYESIKKANGETGIHEYSYIKDGSKHTLKIVFDFSDELAITTFTSGMLKISTDGSTVTLEDAENAALVAGMTKVEA